MINKNYREGVNGDDYDLCESFDSFSGGKKKFVNIAIEFVDRYSITNTSLKFENCTLVFDSTFSSVVKCTGSDIIFENCTFVSKQKPDDEAFVLKDTDVILRECTFDKWDAGLFLSMDGGKLSILECSFLSCGCQLITAEQLVDASVEKCRIKKHKGILIWLSKKKSGEKNLIAINDCVFTDCNCSNLSLFSTRGSVVVNNSTVHNCEMNIAFGREVEYRHCIFDRCHGDMRLLTRKIAFSYCNITNHRGNIGGAVSAFEYIDITSCKLKGFNGSFFAESLNVSNTIFDNCCGDGDGILTGDYLYIKDSTYNLLNVNPTGSLLEIRCNDETAPSRIEKCKFIDCKSSGALIVAFSKGKHNNTVTVNECEIINCQCTDGYFVGVRVKDNKFYLAPALINIYNTKIDLFDEEHQKQLLAFLKSALTEGLVKGCTKFHKAPIEYEIEKNIRKNVMSDIYDEIIMMYDCSFFDNGKSGFVVESQAIYFSQMLESNYIIPYAKIAHIEEFIIEHKKFGDNYDATLIISFDNYRSIEFSDPNIEKNELKKLLIGIKEVFSCVVADKSGSMSELESDTIGDFNATLKEQQAVQNNHRSDVSREDAKKALTNLKKAFGGLKEATDELVDVVSYVQANDGFPDADAIMERIFKEKSQNPEGLNMVLEAQEVKEEENENKIIYELFVKGEPQVETGNKLEQVIYELFVEKKRKAEENKQTKPSMPLGIPGAILGFGEGVIKKAFEAFKEYEK